MTSNANVHLTKVFFNMLKYMNASLINFNNALLGSIRPLHNVVVFPWFTDIYH